MRRIGLVLGAGGVVGHAFHAGVLAALADVTGWDPRRAEVVVGTSAGSVAGALLRAGFSASDLYEEAAAGRPSWRARRRLQRAERVNDDVPAFPAPVDLLGALASPRLVARALATPWAVRPGVAAAALLPEGSLSTEPFADRLRPLIGSAWPSAALWICAVDLDRGRRVVFGRDREAADLVTAVRASCAIPGFFAPVVADGHRYVDGGAHSPTNADLLADEGLDLVIVSSPMSHTGAWPGVALDAPGRAFARAQLRLEERRLASTSTPVVVVQPGRGVRAAMGLNPMQPTHRAETAREAYASTRRWIAARAPRDLLQHLGRARSAAS
jgi:NTE family protein